MPEQINPPRVSEQADSTGGPDWDRLLDQISGEGKIPISGKRKPAVQIRTSESSPEESLSKRPIDIEDLYPSSPVLRPELVTAFRLLEEGLKQITHAINAEKEGDPISSDDAIHRLQALLPELFCCRTIGDGFGAIINAIYHSIINMKGTPLNARQLHVLKKVLSRISTEPFLQFSESVDEIISLEEIGFEVEPSHYKYAGDILK